MIKPAGQLEPVNSIQSLQVLSGPCGFSAGTEFKEKHVRLIGEDVDVRVCLCGCVCVC